MGSRARQAAPRAAVLPLGVVPSLAACTDDAAPDPRAAAADACAQPAVQEHGPGTDGEPSVRRLPREDGDSGYTVTGISGDTERVCTWASAVTSDGTTTEVTIARR